MSKVYVVGSLNQDVVATVDRLPGEGETVHGSALVHLPGGKGANQAVAAGRAGAQVTMVGAIGDDAAGAQLVAAVGGAGVDTSLVSTVAGTPTGTALIAVDAQGHNNIVVVGGANLCVDVATVSALGCGTGDVVVLQNEVAGAVNDAAARRAAQVGATLLYNPAPAGPVGPELLAHVGVLVVNEHEFAEVFGTMLPDGAASVAAVSAAVAAAAAGAPGHPTVVVTLGRRGVTASGPWGAAVLGGYQVDAVDTTGAGDCFVGVLAAGLCQGLGVRSAMVRANAAAALSVTRPGAVGAMPTLKELEAFLTTQAQRQARA